MTFRIKPLYTVSELAAMAGVTPKTMRAMLRSAGVEPVLAGRRWLIPLSEIEQKLYSVRKSLERVEIYREVARESAKK